MKKSTRSRHLSWLRFSYSGASNLNELMATAATVIPQGGHIKNKKIISKYPQEQNDFSLELCCGPYLGDFADQKWSTSREFDTHVLSQQKYLCRAQCCSSGSESVVYYSGVLKERPSVVCSAASLHRCTDRRRPSRHSTRSTGTDLRSGEHHHHD